MNILFGLLQDPMAHWAQLMILVGMVALGVYAIRRFKIKTNV